MHKTLFSIISILLSILVLTPNLFAQDHNKWGLPPGAKIRLGKGSIKEITYSPDGKRIAVASSIGVWIYDAHTGEELDLLRGDTPSVRSVSFSPDGSY